MSVISPIFGPKTTVERIKDEPVKIGNQWHVTVTKIITKDRILGDRQPTSGSFFLSIPKDFVNDSITKSVHVEYSNNKTVITKTRTAIVRASGDKMTLGEKAKIIFMRANSQYPKV